MLTVKNITKKYGKNLVLDGIAIDFNNPEGVYGILGRNGVGKTTLMKIIFNMITNYEGDVEINGLGETLDLLVFTHNDADHIGHGDLVLEYFDVEEVWMNGVDHTTKVYSNLLDAILASDAEYVEPKAGEVYERGNFELEVLHPPVGSPGRDHNDESIVMHVAFDDLSLVTSGDASIPRENEIVDRYGSIPADILIVGHHGAADATGENWLKAVQPKMAFYQAGVNNTYGHPSPDALARLEQYGIPTYGTTELGTISLYFDEQNEVSVETEK